MNGVDHGLIKRVRVTWNAHNKQYIRIRPIEIEKGIGEILQKKNFFEVSLQVKSSEMKR